MNLIVALACGCLFGFGLSLSGMTDVERVTGFLDLAGDWDPTLAFVMGGGLLISLPFFQFGLKRFASPLLATEFRLPNRQDIDFRLLAGAMCFGIGWGLVGLCPGPAIASLAYMNPDIAWFGLAMLLGMLAVEIIDKLRESRGDPKDQKAGLAG
ncbi:MAG: putative membrane protein YedE/YeeE [Candidatus Azotimanducaceae bacterium]|jgi:uncharacterized membrane protein YedE/YeeE